jgi:hypothetical protein
VTEAPLRPVGADVRLLRRVQRETGVLDLDAGRPVGVLRRVERGLGEHRLTTSVGVERRARPGGADGGRLVRALSEAVVPRDDFAVGVQDEHRRPHPVDQDVVLDVEVDLAVVRVVRPGVADPESGKSKSPVPASVPFGAASRAPDAATPLSVTLSPLPSSAPRSRSLTHRNGSMFTGRLSPRLPS